MTNVQDNLQCLTIVLNEKNNSQDIKNNQLNSRNTMSSRTHFLYKKLDHKKTMAEVAEKLRNTQGCHKYPKKTFVC